MCRGASESLADLTKERSRFVEKACDFRAI